MSSNSPADRPLPLDPRRDGLYDPAFEQDSCGVGFVAQLDGRKSHAIVQRGLQVLRNLQHRGACGCDQDTGDGAGILLQMPDPFFRAEAERLGIRLPRPGDYGGRVRLPAPAGTQRPICQRTHRGVSSPARGQTVLGWRPVPVVSSAIGWLARSQEPVDGATPDRPGRGDPGGEAPSSGHSTSSAARPSAGPPPRASRPTPLWFADPELQRPDRSSTRGCSSPTSSPSTSPTCPTRAWSRRWPWSTAGTARTRSRSGAWPSRSTCSPTTARSTPSRGTSTGSRPGSRG